MAKKEDPKEPVTQAPEPDFVPEGNDDITGDGYTPGGAMDLGDFNVDDEWKPSPLITPGTYHGAITDVKYDQEKRELGFVVTLNENGGVMSDGETPIDGTTHMARVYLPKPGDENELSKDGKQTKRQSKINMLKQFATNVRINLSTPTAIATALLNKEWIGLSVDVKLKVGEYLGVHRNEVERLIAREL
jgi:hypothetical protein